MANSKTKVVVALGVLDIARQVATAWASKRQAERDRVGFGAGLREDVAALARDTRDRTRDRLPSHFEWGLPPWRREPTLGERMREWAPVALVAVLSTIGIALTARWIARQEPDADADEIGTNSRMVGAIRAGSEAIDAGTTKVVEGGSAAAIGTASVVAAGSTAVKAAVVDRAKHEVDERVVAPAKQKAIKLGILGVLGLTAYIILIATAVQLIVAAFT